MKTSLRKSEDYRVDFRRQYSLFQGDAIERGGAKLMEEFLGAPTSLRAEGENGWMTFLVVSDEFDRFKKILLERLKSDPEFLRGEFERMDRTGQALIAHAKELAQKTGNSKEEIIEALRSFWRAWEVHVLDVWITFLIGEAGNMLFEELLTSIPEGKQAEALLRYSHPSERAHILNISEYFHKEKDYNLRVKFLIEKYPWLFTTDLFSPRTERSQYEEYARTFKEKEEHSYEGPDLFSLDLMPLVRLYQEILYMKDKRDEYRRQAFWAIGPVVEKVEKVFGVSRDLLWVTRSSDIERLITDREVYEEELRSRQKAWVYESDGATELFFSGHEARTHFLQKKEVFAGEIKGIPGSRGKVTGVAQVILRSEDCRNFEEGKILVATTTNPDYIAAMQKALAFVTDEGGITCHAAIVAREMKKPCVVGCKVATKVISTGDTIEIDAERGVVRKI